MRRKKRVLCSLLSLFMMFGFLLCSPGMKQIVDASNNDIINDKINDKESVINNYSATLGHNRKNLSVGSADSNVHTIMIEAEDVVLNEQAFIVRHDAEASGGKFVTPNINVPDAPPLSEDGIVFEFVAEQPSIYFIWMRYSALNIGQDDGVYKSFDNDGYAATNRYYVTGNNPSDYKWVKIHATDYLEQGSTHSFKLYPKKRGSRIDKFIVTSSVPYKPSGMGQMPDSSLYEFTPLPVYNPAPPILPPAEHPRLLFRSKDIPSIKENMKHPQNQAANDAFQSRLNQTTTGLLELPEKSNVTNYNATILGIIEAKAFDYAINGNEESGREAIRAILNFLSDSVFPLSIQDISRQMGATIFAASQVYDWCYPLLSEEEKYDIMILCRQIADDMESGWPPTAQGSINGHSCEAMIMKDLLSFGIAIYDEFPDIYNFVAGRLFNEFVEPRNYWYQSHSYHEGTQYSNYRYTFDLWFQQLIYRMTGIDIYTPDSEFVGYQYLYKRMPDGLFLAEGDVEAIRMNRLPQYQSYTAGIIAANIASNFYKNPYLKKEVIRLTSGYQQRVDWLNYFLFNDHDLQPRAISELPLTKYFGSPNGTMIARTGWNLGLDAPDVIAFMKIYEQTGGSHNHADAGQFQIYYKGVLANDSGEYDGFNSAHRLNYSRNTIAHNTLMVYSPSEGMRSGWQRIAAAQPYDMEAWMTDKRYKTGKVLGHEFGPDPVTPEYSYISGDITPSYTNGVSEVRRSMLFLPLENEDFPAVFMVMDKIVSPTEDFVKTFLLHSKQEPDIDGNTVVIKRDTNGYNGKLTNQTLYPKDVDIEKIGGPGRQWTVDDMNYVPNNNTDSSLDIGWGRIEISPATSQKEDYLLNVMYVSDADNESPVQQARLIETDDVLGAKIFDRVSVFAKNSKRIDYEFSFEAEADAYDEVKVAVAGLAAGEWTITMDGRKINNAIATQEGGIIYFNAACGKYTLTPTDPFANRPPAEVILPEKSLIDVMVNKTFVYLGADPMVIDGNVLAPVEGIGRQLIAKVDYNESTGSTTVTKGNNVVELTRDSKTAYVNGESVEMPAAAAIADGKLYAPLRFLAEALGGRVEWNEAATTVSISINLGRVFPPQVDIPNVLPIYDVVSFDGDRSVENTLIDDSYNNRWTVSCTKEGTVWSVYDLGGSKYLDSAYIGFHYGSSSRKYVFSLAVSEDGVNYTTVLDHAQSSGKGEREELEKFKLNGIRARYVKYIGYGNTENMWSNVYMMALIERK